MKVKELAKVSHVSSATIVKIENEGYIPNRIDVVRRLAAALNVPIDDMWEEIKHPKRAAAKVA